mgnify:CR=1 FL=1
MMVSGAEHREESEQEESPDPQSTRALTAYDRHAFSLNPSIPPRDPATAWRRRAVSMADTTYQTSDFRFIPRSALPWIAESTPYLH